MRLSDISGDPPTPGRATWSRTQAPVFHTLSWHLPIPVWYIDSE